MNILKIDPYNRPTICKDCGGLMIFKGVGEYKCEDCKKKDFDDYGKVRNYIEENPGATVTVISQETEVSRRSINNMLKESRFEVSNDSKSFLLCEMCGVTIRSGRHCKKCEEAYHQKFEEQLRKSGFSGGEPDRDDTGKRFHREDL